MANTYVKIASASVGSSGATNFSFTSIPSTYTDLVLKVSLRDTASATFWGYNVYFNNSTASNYSFRRLYGTGSGTASDNFSSQSTLAPYAATGGTATASTFGSNDIYIPNYTSSTAKSVSFDGVSENNATSAVAGLTAGLWSLTNAITQIDITASGTFAQYSTATLYGIKNS
jgi:hypothetical protein